MQMNCTTSSHYNAEYGALWGLYGVMVQTIPDHPSPVYPLPPVGWGLSQKPGAQLLAKNFSQKKGPVSKGPFPKIFYPRFFELFSGGVPPCFLKCLSEKFFTPKFLNFFWRGYPFTFKMLLSKKIGNYIPVVQNRIEEKP